ncbi:uroporphyrinogen-III synthase [Lysinibacillus sp. 2017]|uniref:uroporphyrinogen-III synthase n=1 Tax=unclassified Lysinibacillus TaxID=2636778 RepID=UPI000D528374|nr:MULTISPECIES: uroporphyrinogen-III synthase [unclassified Lysinibacillus]AWE08187.1 uroporphyrinogen-III synthase [Lysinibacillus sp. 2017]TGN36309.1 uroporphyrinogen-III synthase [Lysinibacillus sp. S2017]
MLSKPLAGKTLILTGSSVVQSVIKQIEQYGGKVLSYPLIETVEKVSKEEQTNLRNLSNYQWLIFTSQNAVISFIAKCERYSVQVPTKLKIAVVGEKTAALLKQHGFSIHFMPSVFSADVFVKEFSLANNEKALFLRGSMAKNTIHEGTGADEWIVYETKTCEAYLQPLRESLKEEKQPIVLFSSPSAVDVYAKYIVPIVEWGFVKCASIGHVTTAALAKYGVTPIVQPKIYTMQAVIEQLILEETTK